MNKDSFSLKLKESQKKKKKKNFALPYLFIAFNISMTTKMDKLIVVAFMENSFVNMSQPISGNKEGH